MGKTHSPQSSPAITRSQKTPDRPTRRHILRTCHRHNHHASFTPIQHLSLEHLPRCIRTLSVLQLVQGLAQQVVRVRVMVAGDRTQGASGRKRGGRSHTCTGVVTSVGEDYVMVMVPLHAVQNDVEALHTTADFFYDSEDDGEVITVRGLSLTRHALQHTAHLAFRSCPRLGKRFQQLRGEVTVSTQFLRDLADVDPVRHSEGSWVVFISHPHGSFKRVSFGNFCGKDVLTETGTDDVESPKIWEDREAEWMPSGLQRMRSSASETDVTDQSLQPSSSSLIRASASSLLIHFDEVGDQALVDSSELSKPVLESKGEDAVLVPVIRETKSTSAALGTRAAVWDRFSSLCSIIYKGLGSFGRRVFNFPTKAAQKIIRVYHDAASCPGSSGGAVLVIGQRVWAGLEETVTSLPVFLHVGVMADRGVAVPIDVKNKALCSCLV